MTSDFYKIILENIDIPICLIDNNGNVVYSTTESNNLDDFSHKTVTVEGKPFELYFKTTNSQAHQDFVSTVSHELRTPLTSIRGFADTMLSASDKLSKEQQNKFLTIIRNQADRLTRLVENLLEISNISKKDKLIMKEINFKTFISPLIIMFEKKYPNKKYEVITDKNLPMLWADSDILEQIMTNLIDNASKYSDDNKKVVIKAEFANSFINIKVIDEGVKIPENQLNNIFNKFSRIDSPLTRKVEGSGLGLYITKNLIEKLNGTIKAENYEKGNIFTVSLPILSVEKQIKTKVTGEKI